MAEPEGMELAESAALDVQPDPTDPAGGGPLEGEDPEDLVTGQESEAEAAQQGRSAGS